MPKPCRILSVLAAALAIAASAPAAFAGPLSNGSAGPPRSERVPAPTAADGSWRLPAMPMPRDNVSTPARVELGKALFFDPRLSGNGATSCASCHNPGLGWSDGLKTAVGMHGVVLGRATPTIVNTGFNTQFMWDGRKKSLEDQALGPMKAPDEMNTDFPAAIARLASIPAYRALFAKAYPGEQIGEETIAKAIAAFERKIVSNNSPFDRWLGGDTKALSPSQYRGYLVFNNREKGNCAVCHSGPNFTDNGFHNIALTPKGEKPDAGRFNIRKVAAMQGAFKTPTLRDIELTGPYFHDGSATTLRDVVDHYARGGDDRTNVSVDVRRLDLTERDKLDLVAFLRSLTGKQPPVVQPLLPQ